jgi:hypothetical protein
MTAASSRTVKPGTWNYRVMKRNGEHAVHEVFYTATGRIRGFTAEPVYPRAESVAGLKSELRRYARAFSKPVLDFERLEKRMAPVPKPKP